MTAHLVAIEPDRVRVASDGLRENAYTGATGFTSHHKATLAPMFPAISVRWGSVWLGEEFARVLGNMGDRLTLEDALIEVDRAMRPKVDDLEADLEGGGANYDGTQIMVAGWSAREQRMVGYLWRAIPDKGVELEEAQPGLWLSPTLDLHMPAWVPETIPYLDVLAAQATYDDGYNVEVGGEAIAWELTRNKATMIRLGPVPESTDLIPADLIAAGARSELGGGSQPAGMNRAERRRQAKQNRKGKR
jgi:hypothetical protein